MKDFVFCLEVIYPTRQGVGKRNFYFTDRKEAEVFRVAVVGEYSKVNTLKAFLPETCKSALEKLRQDIRTARNEPASSNRSY